MRFRRLIAVAVLVAALMLTGCGGNSEDEDEDGRKVNYAKVYNPDGTLLAEGEYDSCWVSYGTVTVRIDGVKYQTGYTNVVTMCWYE